MKADGNTRKELHRLLYLPVSPRDINIFAFYFYGVFWIALSPTWQEAIIAIAIESILMAISFLRPVQLAFTPASFMPLVKFSSGETLERKDLLLNLVQLPFNKARHLTLFYVIKNATISALIPVYLWEHPGYSNLEQYGRYMLLEFFVLTIFFFWVYVTAHKWSSQILRRLQMEGNFLEEMRHFEYPQQVPFRSVLFGSLALLSLLAIAVLVVKFGPVAEITTIHKWQVVYLVGGFMAFVLYQIKQIFDLIMLQMDDNVQALSGFQRRGIGQLPISTINFLGQYQSLTNRFLAQLREKERELASWVLNAAESDRSDYIGSISSLIAHDLASPITTLKYCIDRLADNDKLEADEIRHMQVSAGHLFDLSKTLRNALRVDDIESYALNDAVRSARSLVDIEFSKNSSYKKIAFQIELGEQVLRIAGIPKLYLIQVLTNLLKNSINSLLKGQPDSMLISIKGHDSDEFTEVHLNDSADDFTQETFEGLTAENAFIGRNTQIRKGLGLRMSLRILEAYGGTLTYVDGAKTSPSYFYLKIPKKVHISLPAI